MGHYCYASRVFIGTRQYAAAWKQTGYIPLGAWVSNSNSICPHVLGICESSLEKIVSFFYPNYLTFNQLIPNDITLRIQMQAIGYK